MNGEEFEEVLRETFENVADLVNIKGDEYASTVNRFANFERLAVELNQPPETILWIYVSKHWDALRRYVKDLAIDAPIRALSDPTESRIDDVIVYLIFLKAMKRAREAQRGDPNPFRPLSGAVLFDDDDGA